MLDNGDKQKMLDRMLQMTPEEVLAQFQAQLKEQVTAVEAGLFVLEHPDATADDKTQVIEALKTRMGMVRDGLNLTQVYLKKRTEQQSRKPPKR